mmetsp:Transcript_27321/g.83025  ORF Transcript_27321/g.83025 Transcript_27321/m.83025 type:complete len:211 (-) Transcript_27321:928-1560(-)
MSQAATSSAVLSESILSPVGVTMSSTTCRQCSRNSSLLPAASRSPIGASGSPWRSRYEILGKSGWDVYPGGAKVPPISLAGAGSRRPVKTPCERYSEAEPLAGVFSGPSISSMASFVTCSSGASSTRSAVHWPECSMVEEAATAFAMGRERPSATMRFGPCVEAIMPGACLALIFAARPRAPVKRKGVSGASDAVGSAAAAAAEVSIRSC